ncbi:DNA polymerase III subunit delta' [Methylocella sp.]|uniref:DNA polymerase III subunit delta' n=1 Tax=Methylocella sp. TaxID=1978226 RepID=UPI0035B0D23C
MIACRLAPNLIAMAAKLSSDADGPPEADRFGDAPHPRTASRLVAHAEAEAELLRACASGKLPQAILIGGPPGVGKATLAWRLARFLLVHRDPDDAAAAADLSTPQDHPAVRQAIALSHPDLFLLRRGWNEKDKRHWMDIRVDDVRRMIHMFQQSGSGYRVGVVDSADDLNASSANALLKLIEEPPPRSLVMILAHRPGRVLPTIRSRCRKIMLKPLAAAEIGAVIEGLGAPFAKAYASQAATVRADDTLHAALRRLSGSSEFDLRMRRLLEELPRLDWRTIQAAADHVSLRDNADDYRALLDAVGDWLGGRVRALAPHASAPSLAPYAEVWEKAGEAARRTEALNLDKRPFILSLFADLADAERRSGA